MRTVLKIGVLAWALVACACTTVRDLDAPCKDFGRFCHQEPINVVAQGSR